MNSIDSQTIKLLRFPLTFIVVVQHSMGVINTKINWEQLTGMDYYMLIKYFISGCFALVAVPVFFFISGYLFFNKIEEMNRNVYCRKMKMRIRSLLVPYILWNLITIPIMLGVKYCETFTGTSTQEAFNAFVAESQWMHVFWDFTSNDATFKNLFGWTLLKSNPILSTFWYVRDLLIMMFLSPLIWWWFKYTRKWGLLILIVALVLRIWPHITLGPQSLFFRSEHIGQ